MKYDLPGEDVKYMAKMHWFIFVRPIVLLLIGYWFIGATNNIIHILGIVLLVIGAITFLQRLFTKVGSEYTLTSKRVILKSGFIKRDALELLLNKCEGLRISQSVLGRIFNYGSILITTGGATNCYHYVTNPLEFRKQINVQISAVG